MRSVLLTLVALAGVAGLLVAVAVALCMRHHSRRRDKERLAALGPEGAHGDTTFEYQVCWYRSSGREGNRKGLRDSILCGEGWEQKSGPGERLERSWKGRCDALLVNMGWNSSWNCFQDYDSGVLPCTIRGCHKCQPGRKELSPKHTFLSIPLIRDKTKAPDWNSWPCLFCGTGNCALRCCANALPTLPLSSSPVALLKGF